MAVSIEEIKKLKELTGLGLTDAKKALVEADGDFDKALEALRKKGLTKAEKKGEREAREGLVESYVHGGRIGVIVEVNCETDFVARTEEFQHLGHEIAMQIAAANPGFIVPEDVPECVVNHEIEVIKAQALEEGKPEKMLDKIAEGRINKFYEENCLMEQKYIRDPDKKIKDLVIENIAKIGENIKVGRFSRFIIEG